MNTEDLLKIAQSSKNRFDMWSSIINALQIKSVAEVGVFRGEFAARILEMSSNIDQYLMVDPWRKLNNWDKPYNKEDNHFEEIYREAMSKTEFAKDKITVLRETTSEAVKHIPDKSLDFAYIDGDHTLRGITIDLIKMLPKIKLKGLIVGDDFNKNTMNSHMGFEPTMVCPYAMYFAEAMNLPFVCLPFNQFLIVNDPSQGYRLIDFVGGYKDLSLKKMLLARQQVEGQHK